MDYFSWEKIKSLILPSFIQSKILLFCVVLLFVLRIATVLIFINFPNNIFFADVTKIALENFANQARQSVGLTPLAINDKLNQAAMLKAENMVQNQYFNHTSPKGISPWHWFLEAGYNYKYAGENLAIGFFDSQELFQAWLDSPSHRDNILNPNYKDFGTAVLTGYGGNNTIVVVQEFGSQLTVVAKQNIAPKHSQQIQGTEQPEQPELIEQEEVVLEQTPSQNTTQQPLVLSQTSVIEANQNNSIDNLFSRIMNLFLYSYQEILQKIIYSLSLVIIGVLMIIIFFNSNMKFKRDFAFRSMLLIFLIALTLVADRSIVIYFIPGYIII